VTLPRGHDRAPLDEGPLDRLEVYLDGAMSPGEKAEFERLASSHSALRRELDAALAVHGAVRRLGTPPTTLGLDALDAAVGSGDATADVPAPIPISRGRVAPAKMGRWIGYAAAAMIGVVGVVWWSSTVPDPEARRVLTAGQVLAVAHAEGFKPAFVCKDDAEFVATVKNRFGTGLLVASTESVAVLGWAYSDTYGADLVSKDTLVLMARVEGREVLVFMDRAPGERVLKPGDVPAGYRLLRKPVGGLMLYELTPFESARVIDAARIVD